jgi:putative ABC transport system permease protein
MRQMRILRNVRLGLKTLLLHKLRSILTMLGVVFGVGSVVAMLSVGEGASQAQLEQIRKLGTDNIVIRAEKPTEEQTSGTMRAPMSVYGLLYDDYQRIREIFPAVRRVVPVKHMPREGRLGERSLDLRIVGTTQEWFQLVRRPVIAGRILIERDLTENAKVAVLTEYGARRLLATEAAIGEHLRVAGKALEVIGIVRNESGRGAEVPVPDQNVDAYIPITTAREMFGDINTRRTSGSFERELVELHQIIVQVKDTEQVEAVADGIKAMLQRFHRKNDWAMDVPLELLRQREATKRTFNIVLGSIAGISLIVGGIGIMNIMLASVTERTREIGIRRAIGAKRRQIVGQFLIETVTLSTIGGIVGVILGTLLPFFIENYFKMPTVVTGYSLILSVGVSMVVGVFFGLYPAMRAARLDPIVALRHE